MKISRIGVALRRQHCTQAYQQCELKCILGGLVFSGMWIYKNLVRQRVLLFCCDSVVIERTFTWTGHDKHDSTVCTNLQSGMNRVNQRSTKLYKRVTSEREKDGHAKSLHKMCVSNSTITSAPEEEARSSQFFRVIIDSVSSGAFSTSITRFSY